MSISIKRTQVGITSENCYLLHNDNEAFLIDPGDDFSKIVCDFELDTFTIKAIINTHGHYDHIGAISDLKNKYNIPFYIHSFDKRIVGRGNLYKHVTGDFGEFKTPSIDDVLDHKHELTLGNSKIYVHHIPGHTQGCVCFEFNKSLIIGDVILEDSIGRTDLPGGSRDQMLKSLEYIFSKFENYLIFPGHGNEFVLTREKIVELKKAYNVY